MTSPFLSVHTAVRHVLASLLSNTLKSGQQGEINVVGYAINKKGGGGVYGWK